ncbi:MAG: hypothetical protein K2I10_13995 [Lachnospiraceae bacterium]|nr:hypothetical protein [Lachnospiraceae bacterium]
MNILVDLVSFGKDDRVLEKYIEREYSKNIDVKFFCEVIGFDKNAQILIYRKSCDLNMIKEVNKMLECSLVVLKAKNVSRIIVWILLWIVCRINKCFGPIVFSKEQEIFFFPKLRYEDTLLVKNIVENTFGYDNCSVAYCGKRNIIVV